MKVDILVLNYNGKSLLEAYLPSVIAAAKKSSHECRAYVVDNKSADGSVEFLKEKFPEAGIIEAKENRVLCSYNEAVQGLSSDIVIFLNNDIKVEPDFVDKLVGHFDDASVMFVAPRLLNFDGTYNGGRSYLELRNGALKVTVDASGAEKPGETQAISTGAFRRRYFLDLGGFDDLYLPGIWEDVDLCFKGLMLGYKGVYDPSSVIWHDESTTFHKVYGKKKKMTIAHRNMFLFFWKNVTNAGFLLNHAVFLLPRLVALALKGNTEPALGFFQALGKLPLVVRKRKAEKKFFEKRVLGDREIIR